MILRLAVFVVIGLAYSTGIATAQVTPPVSARDTGSAGSGRVPAHWDLQTCIDYAKKNNITLNSLRLNIRTAEQNYLLAKAARQPNLTGAVSGTYTHSKNTNPVISGFQTQSSFANNYSLISGV